MEQGGLCMKRLNDLIVSIDIGTSKISVLVAQPIDNDTVEIIGVGKSPSEGLSKGVVVDIAKTVQSIKLAVKEAEIMAGCAIENAYIGISGAHIHSRNSHGVVAIKRGEVTDADIAHVIESAKAVPLEQGQQILHVLPQYYTIDGGDKLIDPRGMFGVRLEAQVHIISGAIASVQNLIKCCESAGVKVVDVVLEQLASAYAVLSEDERQLGVAMLDIGGGTSDLALYQHGSIRHTMVLPIAGNHFTNDLAIGLCITRNDAERIKKTHGVCYRSMGQEAQEIDVECVQGGTRKTVSCDAIISILEPRAAELLSLIAENIEKSSMRSCMPAGLVLTGGGSLLSGMQELARDIFGCSVRTAIPRLQHTGLESLNHPMYATGYGLLLYALKKYDTAHMKGLNGPMVTRVFARMKSWVSDFF
jgi:cell division protein FtsA